MISVLTAYLCCQLRRWLALIAVAIFSGGDTMQYAVPHRRRCILLLKAAPAIRFCAVSTPAVPDGTFLVWLARYAHPRLALTCCSPFA